MEEPRNDVTVHVPTAVMDLSASAPDGVDVTADDIIKFQAGQLQAASRQLAEKDLALNTITNLAGCAIKFMIDKGYGDEDGPDTISFSRLYLDQMRDCSLQIREDFAGGYTVQFTERADGLHAVKGG